jgi:hypothetical protein
MTLVRKLRVHPCSKSLLEVESKECFHLVRSGRNDTGWLWQQSKHVYAAQLSCVAHNTLLCLQTFGAGPTSHPGV